MSSSQLHQTFHLHSSQSGSQVLVTAIRQEDRRPFHQQFSQPRRTKEFMEPIPAISLQQRMEQARRLAKHQLRRSKSEIQTAAILPEVAAEPEPLPNASQVEVQENLQPRQASHSSLGRKGSTGSVTSLEGSVRRIPAPAKRTLIGRLPNASIARSPSVQQVQVKPVEEAPTFELPNLKSENREGLLDGVPSRVESPPMKRAHSRTEPSGSERKENVRPPSPVAPTSHRASVHAEPLSKPGEHPQRQSTSPTKKHHQHRHHHGRHRTKKKPAFVTNFSVVHPGEAQPSRGLSQVAAELDNYNKRLRKQDDRHQRAYEKIKAEDMARKRLAKEKREKLMKLALRGPRSKAGNLEESTSALFPVPVGATTTTTKASEQQQQHQSSNASLYATGVTANFQHLNVVDTARLLRTLMQEKAVLAKSAPLQQPGTSMSLSRANSLRSTTLTDPRSARNVGTPSLARSLSWRNSNASIRSSLATSRTSLSATATNTTATTTTTPIREQLVSQMDMLLKLLESVETSETRIRDRYEEAQAKLQLHQDAEDPTPVGVYVISNDVSDQVRTVAGKPLPPLWTLLHEEGIQAGIAPRRSVELSKSLETQIRIDAVRRRLLLHQQDTMLPDGLEPWQLVQNLERDLLEEVLEEVAQEYQQTLDMFVDDLFQSEFKASF